jgi:hypothetical protein
MLDPTIRVTDLVTTGALIMGGLAFLWSMKNEIRMLSRDVRLHSVKLDKLEAVIKDLAVQEQRMVEQDRRITDQGRQIEELRHWRGFVNPDGEYDRQGRVRPTVAPSP